MAELTEPGPATDTVQDTSATSPATDGGKSEIAGQIKDALAGNDRAIVENTPHEQLRRDIEGALGKATDPETSVGKPGQVGPDGRVRGPDGRFAPKEAAAAVADPNAPVVDPAAAVADTASAAPASWGKAVKEQWAALPPEVRAEITKRETDVEKGFAKYQSLRSVEPLIDWAGQVSPRFGIDGPSLIRSWAQFQEALLDPARATQAVAQIIKQYNIAPPRGAPGQPQPQAQPPQGAPATAQNTWVDPELKAVRDQLAAVNQWRTQLEHEATQYQQMQVQQSQQAKLSAVETFGAEKGPDGQPLRPHFEAVMPDMVAGIAKLRATNPNLPDQDVLKQAYDAAVWGNSDTRAKVLEAQRLADETERTTKARERAQASSRAAVSPASASPQGPITAQPLKGTVRDQMAQAYAQLTT